MTIITKEIQIKKMVEVEVCDSCGNEIKGHYFYRCQLCNRVFCYKCRDNGCPELYFADLIHSNVCQSCRNKFNVEISELRAIEDNFRRLSEARVELRKKMGL